MEYRVRLIIVSLMFTYENWGGRGVVLLYEKAGISAYHSRFFTLVKFLSVRYFST